MKSWNKAPLVSVAGALVAVLAVLVAIVATQHDSIPLVYSLLSLAIVMLVVLGIVVGIVIRKSSRE